MGSHTVGFLMRVSCELALAKIRYVMGKAEVRNNGAIVHHATGQSVGQPRVLINFASHRHVTGPYEGPLVALAQTLWILHIAR